MGEGAKAELTREELVELNNKFHRKTLLNDVFYKQLMQAGFAYRKCLLISIFPDGANTFCGKMIRQDGRVVEFDIDLDADKFSSWEDVTDSFNEMYAKNNRIKPWLKEIVAYDLFREILNNNEKQ